ncbi:MAG: esterase-like activity of phytase family protein [Gammaproteobacteria bacterium]|nr:esterase-like activity of phytase family protein [Gammaproteobacteria bacterium]
MFRLLLLVHLTFLLLPQPSGAQEVGRPLPLSDHLATGDDYMGIRLLGALSLQGREALAELSDLAWDEDEGILYSVTDRGRLLHLLPVIEQDRLVNIKLLRHFDLLDETGKKLRKSERDAEGLALEQSDNGVAGDSLLAVSFEGHNRVALYSAEGEFRRSVKMPKVLRDPKLYKSGNKGLEALARHREFGYITGPEMAKERGAIPLFSQTGQRWYYRPLEPNGAVVALEALDDGTLLILERAFSSIFEPLVISLSSSRPTKANTDSALETRLLARFDNSQGWRTQNFEGLTRYRGNRFFMVSDDGGESFLQTQLLYFEIR